MSNHIALSQIVGDIVAGSAVIGSLAGYLPEIAAGMAIIYYVFQFYRWLDGEAHDRHDTHHHQHRDRHHRRDDA